MGTDNQTKPKRRSLEVKQEKLLRFKAVRRKLADVENRDLSDVGLLDEVVTAFLEEQEARFGIKPHKNEASQVPRV